jgi:hypothetical protein
MAKGISSQVVPFLPRLFSLGTWAAGQPKLEPIYQAPEVDPARPVDAWWYIAVWQGTLGVHPGGARSTNPYTLGPGGFLRVHRENMPEFMLRNDGAQTVIGVVTYTSDPNYMYFSRKTSTLILDQFTAADGVLLVNRLAAPLDYPGAVWQTDSGRWAIATNRAQADGGGNTLLINPDLAHLDPGVHTITVRADIYFDPAPAIDGGCGLVVRYQDAGDFWLVILDVAGATLDLYEISSGNTTLRATTSAPIGGWQPQTIYTLTVQVSAAQITADVDNAETVSYPSMTTGLAATAVGILSYSDGVSGRAFNIDNFEVIG